jgi:hypothetical protein
MLRQLRGWWVYRRLLRDQAQEWRAGARGDMDVELSYRDYSALARRYLHTTRYEVRCGKNVLVLVAPFGNIRILPRF